MVAARLYEGRYGIVAQTESHGRLQAERSQAKIYQIFLECLQESVSLQRHARGLQTNHG